MGLGGVHFVMDDWDCTLCGEKVPAHEILTMNHFRLMHPDLDVQDIERWPDGELVIHEEYDPRDDEF